MQFFMDNNSVNHYRVLDIYFVMLVTWKLHLLHKHYTLIVRTLSVRQTPLSWELFSSRKNLTLPLDICGDLREGMGGDTTWVGLTTGEASLVGGETEQSFSLSRKSTGLRRIMGSYNTKGTITTTSQLGFWIWSLFLIIS